MKRRWWVVGLAAVASGLGLASCASLSKAEVEARLRALPGNAPAGRHGLRREVLGLEVDGLDAAAEIVWMHVPAAAPSGHPPVVLVHGTPGTLFQWTGTIFGTEGVPGLAADRDVYALELLDHGLAPSTEGPASFQRCADYVSAFVAALELPPVVLVGHSYGGEAAWRAALDRPELFAGLVLVDSAGLERRDDEWLPEEVAMREWPGASWGWLLNSSERIARALDVHFMDGSAPEVAVEEMTAVCANPENWGAMVDLCRDENGTRQDELPRLTVPTLLLWGAEDSAYTVERFARRFEQAIPDAELVLIPDCGHYPYEERPAEFLAALRAFADR